jgi:lipopolysaccharide export LptBFGC system permease protein LptF
MHALIISIVIVLVLFVLAHALAPSVEKLNQHLEGALTKQTKMLVKLERQRGFIYAIGYIQNLSELKRGHLTIQDLKELAENSESLSQIDPDKFKSDPSCYLKRGPRADTSTRTGQVQK